MQDTIVREITVKATKERVYNAIADPKQITTWFPDNVKGTLEVGEQSILSFDGWNHQTRIYVEAAKPFSYFAYRWVPGGSAPLVDDVQTVPNTLVEFRLEEAAEGTKITLKESGFASLPPEVAEASLKDNNGGWDVVMGRFEKVMSEA